MPSVDDRIVRMQFDNAEFERKVQGTIASLAQLNNALKMEGASKGLTDVNAAAQGVNFGNMHEGISSISAKFLAMSTVAITALANITNKVIDTGIQMGKSLSMDNIMGGFADYELKIGASQTIMAGTGESLGTVTGHLKELDTYADKTIYNLRDMVGNMSKFTNAGVALPVATKAMIGVANAAALSGANSEEASRAMYNLGQAIGQGTVKLIDWKSIELANMGTVEFKQQLIDSAVAMGTLSDAGDGVYKTLSGVDVTTKNFGTTLAENWLTSEALTETLGRYGDQTTEIGKKAWAAAQDVKSFSMMTETLKAGISTGWTDTFDIVIGDLEESKSLFTSLTGIIGGFFGRMAEGRNELLSTWKAIGGRRVLIEGLFIGLHAIVEALKPIKEAFQEVFPPMTGRRLMDLTEGFRALMVMLIPSEKTIGIIKTVFKTFFQVLEIGWIIIKEGAKFIRTLFQSLTEGSAGPALDFITKLGESFSKLADKLTSGGGIVNFFASLTEKIQPALAAIDKVKDKIVDFFSSLGVGEDATSKVGDAVTGVGDKFEVMGVVFGRITERIKMFIDFMAKVGEIIGNIASEIGSFLSDIGGKIADAFGEGDFNQVLDILNVALLGGIVYMLRKFFKEGFKFDVTGGLMDKVRQMFEQLTGVLKALQMQIKANAIKSIAISIAILTASVLVLSLIDSVALSKALTAMAVGFGQLIGAFALINKIQVDSPGKFIVLAASMMLLGAAVLVLAIAAKSLAELDPEEMAIGLGSITLLMGGLVGAMQIMKTNEKDMIRGGGQILLLALAMNVLAIAVKQFASMSIEELVKGLGGVGVGLGIIVGAMHLMPDDMEKIGLGILLLAFGLRKIADVVEVFGKMGVAQLVQGMIGMGATLLIIAGALHLMPDDLNKMAVELLLVAGAVFIMAKAIEIIGEMSTGDMVQALLGLGAGLLMLVIAANAMETALPGIHGLIVAAAALAILAVALKIVSSIPFPDLLLGLLGIALAITVLAVAAAVLSATGAIVAMEALGVALILIGGGFALFGAGVYLVAEGLATLASIGKKGAEGITATLEAVGKAIPSLAAGFAEGIIQLITIIGDAAPTIMKAVGKLLSAMLDVIIEYIPKALEVIGLLVSGIIDFLIEHVPEYALMGVEILMGILSGIRDNIGEIVTIVGEIITGFLDALAEQVDSIIESVTNLFVTIWTGVAEALGKLASTMLFGVGIAFFNGFLDGLVEAFGGIVSWLWEQIRRIPEIFMEFFGIASPSTLMMGLGSDLINGLLNGITTAATAVMNFFTSLVTNILSWIGDLLSSLWQKGTDLITGLLTGIGDKALELASWFTGLVTSVLGWIGEVASSLLQKGKDFIGGLLNGIKEKAVEVFTWYGGLYLTILQKIGDVARALYDKGKDFIKGLWDGIWDRFQAVSDWLGDIKDKFKGFFTNAIDWLFQLGKDIVQGLWNGIKNVWTSVTGWVEDKVGDLVDKFTHPWDAFSPSKVMIQLGHDIGAGMVIGLDDSVAATVASAENLGNRTFNALMDSMSMISEGLEDISEFNPTITPVLDLTQVEAEAAKISAYIQESQSLVPAFSYTQARTIASSTNAQQEETVANAPATGGVNFEQNIYAPTQLSTADIYKQTRNQITMAKEELSIP